jgi:Peroxiredoxin
MIRSLLLFTCLLLGFGANAKDGYRIELKLKNNTDTLCYLAHYFGKPLPTIYKTDSARIDKSGHVVLEGKEKLLGGIYMILLSDKKTYFEFLLDNGDNVTITADVLDMANSVSIKNAKENDHFQDYMKFLQGYGKRHRVFLDELSKAQTKADTVALQKKYEYLSTELNDYRKNYAKNNPQSLLAKIFNAMEVPVTPKEILYKADGKTIDTNANYHYYKDHYWDKFDFTDDRLVNTPVYDGKLEEYIDKLVSPTVDSLTKEGSWLLSKTKGSKELFKYTLWWLTRRAEESKIMGLDEAFVYFVENYYMKGDAYWLSSEDLAKYIDRAKKIAPNVIGNLAPEIELMGIDNKMHKLSDVKAKYTILVFWSPDCGHCTTEVPKLDSVYRAVLKSKGTQIYGVKTESDEKKWKEVIEKNKLNDWIHVYDHDGRSRFRGDYDIYSTPVIYLLDEKKIIRAKRIDHSNIASVVEMLERKEKEDKGKTSQTKQ